MKALLIPVKDFTRAKQRLAPVFTQAERTRLAWVMLEHVFRQVGRVRGLDATFVVTTNNAAADLARRLGMEVIQETAQVSESVSVDFACRLCQQRSVTTLLRLPIDIPLVQAQDIEAILARTGSPPSAVLVPSRDGRGTNALARTPPDLFPSHFGPDSLAKHLREASRAGAACDVMELPSVATDLDDPSDVLFFMECGVPARETSTYRFLSELGAVERIKAWSLSTSHPAGPATASQFP